MDVADLIFVSETMGEYELVWKSVSGITYR